jgi:hypothetical protein
MYLILCTNIQKRTIIKDEVHNVQKWQYPMKAICEIAMNVMLVFLLKNRKKAWEKIMAATVTGKNGILFFNKKALSLVRVLNKKTDNMLSNKALKKDKTTGVLYLAGATEYFFEQKKLYSNYGDFEKAQFERFLASAPEPVRNCFLKH